MTQEDHYDVASYALGVLDDRDAARFEDHLIECPQCAYELESFVQVADVLADVDAEALLAAEKSEKDGVLLNKMLREVRTDRRRANSRRLYSLAAAVVIFAMLSIGALFAGARWLGPDNTPGNGGVVAQRDSSQLDPLPDSDGVGIGGTPLPGDNYNRTDSRTGVSAAVGLEKKDWGTQISFAVSNIKGPKTCGLVLVRTDGTAERVASWTIGEKGWGTAANPSPLMLQAVTGTAREDIAHVQVQELTANGTGETLISIP
ncbi:anti-sigma factor family protein [Actinoplanes teichomyceticus]|uniref:Putative zinc finger protein n=1 Tax=Actinoplanes teichomyceticus TaxID=1867 RepID=A0A561WMT3_ACTTI|nr:zf-HC2 domain-containing protein [Actinoplanes teichomyceticus]TWG25169.1 putative zinc finger protein [Actinoplanes teichomyceticus]GIF10239.1 RNA polymerase subunit sigma [Actinoplanes teichomyceticus]